MNSFQKLLLAPSALGLFSPAAVQAADVNIAGLGDYSIGEQVTSVTQFSDVQPTDWAYQALSNLIERYGCVAGYPNGSFRGNRAMTRYEAAALLNACLDRITEVTDELKRLMKEFERELAITRGRVDGLEAKVGELQATQFSTTTKLRGFTRFVVGANSFTGTNTASGDQVTKYTTAFKKAKIGATTFNYDQRLFLDTSFTGKDLLRTMLRAGNFQPSAYNYGLLKLDPAFQEPAGPNVVGVNRLFYAFPMGEKFKFNVGARVRIDDPGMLAIGVPSVYKAGLLDFFSRAGSPAVYNKSGFGSGFGGTYNKLLGVKGLAISSNYVASDGDQGNPAEGGIMTAGSNGVSVTQLGYLGKKAPWVGGNYAIALGYTYAQNSKIHRATPYGFDVGFTGPSNSYGVSGYWIPEKTGWIPTVSLGWGVMNAANASWAGGSDAGQARIPYRTNYWAKTQSWMVGLQWNDALRKGNKAGLAVGQAPFVTDNGGGSVATVTGTNTPMDSNYMWEWWYEYQVSDNISIKPALYYISNLDGQYGKYNTSTGAYNAKDNVFGGLVMTTFRF